MNFLIVIVLLIAAVVGFFGLARLLGWETVDGWWERMKGTWSSRFQIGTLATLIANLPIDPTHGLTLWNMMPRNIQAFIPQPVLIFGSIFFAVAAWGAAYVKQHKLRAKIEAKKQ